MPPDLESLRSYFTAKSYLLTAHASERAAEREIDSTEIEAAIRNGDVIEDYPNDKYGPSCLILGQAETGRLLHIQVSYPVSIKVITVYEPSSAEWEADFRTRKRQ
ncbi:MAG: DUF4258 domain-containing protein [Caldilineaceae bacterium]|nr:DUF4258 domain-containing protein [Caldilineaceae bacterium]